MDELEAPRYRVPLRLQGVEGRIATFVVPSEFAEHIASATPAKNAWTRDFNTGLVGGVCIDRSTTPPTVVSYLTRPLKQIDVAGEGWVALLRRDTRPRAKRPYQLVSVTRSIGPGKSKSSDGGPAPVPVHIAPPMALDDRI
ncbi:hypothetical protein CK505_05710 [Kocuria sp. WN036]|uniref:hypothetical protein n=1 Tax=Kocuria sp. WN036 TaxID=2032628 RepID=UPI000BABF775|nr:hypothetical protein [Kocuria sp. WN036]PAU91390.1 hypothetical protein CK505_05710 [Kocuria sp. WN036]